MIKRIVLENVGVIPALTIEMDSVVLVEGDNGVGKTTIIRAIKTTFDGGVYPDLVGPLGDECKVNIQLMDGSDITRIHRKANAKRKKATAEYIVLRPDGTMMDSPAEWVSKLCSGLLLDPTELVHTPKAKRLEFFQKTVTIEFKRDELEAATGKVLPGATNGFNLDQFDSLLEGQMEERKRANNTKETLAAHRAQLAKTIPAGADNGDWKAEAAKLAEELEAAKDERRGLDAGIDKSVAQAERVASDTKNEAFVAAKKVYEQALQDARDAYDGRIREIQDKAKAMLAKEVEPIDARISDLTARHATARANADAQARITGTKEALKEADGKIKLAVTEYAALDKSIANLRELRMKKLEKMPIPGMELKPDGTLIINELDYDTQINTAMQFFYSFKLAKAARGTNNGSFWLFDKAEALTGENRRIFAEAVKKDGSQVIMATRTEEGDPLQVRSLFSESSDGVAT